jgi:hypothetical protein
MVKVLYNPYPGVNPHFQSFCQAHNDWEGFHGQFIASLVAHLNQGLPPGYLAKPERSLQIRQLDPLYGDEQVTRYRPDVNLLHQGLPPNQGLASTFAPSPDALLDLHDTLPNDPSAYLRNLMIYEALPDQIYGQPITQIEVLSPSNKAPGGGYWQYIYKRDQVLRAGLNLVEVDLLHESRSPIENLPAYTPPDSQTSPYYIAISRPYPSLAEGQTAIYHLKVDQAIPRLQLPLKAGETVEVDFGATYHQAFQALRAGELLDYSQVPLNFERYTRQDQMKILAVMADLRNET